MAVQHVPKLGVPFLDLSASNARLTRQLLVDIERLLESGAFTNGPNVASFEDAFAAYCGTTHCVGVASGLDALRLGLSAAGLEDGDEVIVPAATFVATVEAVIQAGGVPVLADISEEDYCLDVDAASAAVSARTHSFMPVHLYGQLADLRALKREALSHGVLVIEDACQAHGAERDGYRAGTAGDLAAFSFYPGKNLGAAGDAGALVTSDPELAARVRSLREHGQTAKYVHARLGWTARLDTIQALVLEHKLPLLDEWNEQRREAARFYGEALAGVGDLVLPPVATGSTPAWHLYVVRTGTRDQLAALLKDRGIGTGLHYPDPVHLTEACAYLGHRAGSFPAAERLSRECLSLPMFPGITEAQLSSVVESVRAYFDG
jgi:dTDP-4-amino-4,6-dideoxygalactose transaminase